MNILNDLKDIETQIKNDIRDVPDFPKKGILFKDITPLLNNGPLFQKAIHCFAERFQYRKPDAIVSVESRGFFLGAPLAVELGVGIVPVRKMGKLPRATRTATYQLEYGTDSLQIHEADLKPNQKILVVDDVLATGGTISAVIQLVEGLGCQVMEIDFLIELSSLKGREKLKGYPIYSMIQY